MQIIFFLFWQLASYNIVTWLVFIAIAFLTARYFPWWCIPIGHLVVGAIVFFLDIRWIQAEMSRLGWDGTPDMDFVFDIGMLIRIFLVNTVLLPVSFVGFQIKKRSKNLNHTKIHTP